MTANDCLTVGVGGAPRICRVGPQEGRYWYDDAPIAGRKYWGDDIYTAGATRERVGTGGTE